MSLCDQAILYHILQRSSLLFIIMLLSSSSSFYSALFNIYIKIYYSVNVKFQDLICKKIILLIKIISNNIAMNYMSLSYINLLIN